MSSIKLADDSPVWLEAGLSELERIQNPERNKKINTLIALIDARLAGQSDASAFKRADTVSRNIWYEKWSKDESIRDVLNKLELIARSVHDERAIRTMAAAASRIQLASAAAAGKAISLMSSSDEAIALRASFGILDRAGVETATKNSVAHDGTIDHSGEIIYTSAEARSIFDILAAVGAIESGADDAEA